MDEWKRFANAAVQEELIAQTEALKAKYRLDAEGGPAPADIEKAARDLHEIQERWKQVAEAPRAQAQALWHRYRQAADPIQAKAREFFASRSEERKTNLDRKLALIERAEALAESTDWIKTAEELKTLQRNGSRPAPCRAATRARPGSGSARRATSSSPAATPTSPSARKPGRPTSPRRKRCAPAPRSCRPRATGIAPPPRSVACRPSGRPSARCAATSPK